MPFKNLRKYICVDCGHYQMLKPYIFSSANKPHCTNCGSTFLELSKASKRRKEETIINDIKKSGAFTVNHKRL